MARPTTWYRGLGEYANSASKANHHELSLATLTTGQTVTRIRFRYLVQHTNDFPSEAIGFGVALGIALLDTGDDPALVLNPETDPSADYWMWWEASFFRPAAVGDDTNGHFELDVGPDDPGERDVRAQRIVDGNQTLWLVTQTSALGGTQAQHYLSASWSVLTLDA